MRLPPPPPPSSRPLLPPRARRASGREARRVSVRTACCEAPSGLIKESNIDDVPARRRPTSYRTHGCAERGEGGREEGGDNINSADDKMMRGVFSLAEMNMARIAERRGGIRGFGKSIRGGNIEQDQCLFMFVRKMIGRGRLYYSSPSLLSARLKCECGQKGNESPRRPTPKCRERGASYKTQLSEEPPGFLPSKAVFAARRRGSRGDRQRTGKQACKPLFICT